MKKLICLVMILCLATSVAVHAETADRTGWEQRDIGTSGISMMLPPDMTEIKTGAEDPYTAFAAQNDQVMVIVLHDPGYEACETVEEMARTLEEASGEKTETELRGNLGNGAHDPRGNHGILRVLRGGS